MVSAAKDLFTEQLRLPGKLEIEPGKFVAVLQLQIHELAQLAGVHRATVRDALGSLRLQTLLRESLRVLAAATDLRQSSESNVLLP